MRNKNRIDPFLNKFKILWEQNPDLRFGQLVTILSCEVNQDEFNAEEEEWLLAIEKFTDK